LDICTKCERMLHKRNRLATNSPAAGMIGAAAEF